ncbi:MAG: hypothetical protein DWQ47_05975 [Acidobacteria bacterium]|nr:MAG: hypothetical protein DWQ32_09525 [Acidobacteriota bacterium]REK01927.1 MAG: hypothetical protein DWQ38_05960 [Acidobacteriota bacterium]REK14883.1 MAG: hypothetical protein DWQ43_15215 [Acidobacteriota bacterium]REK45598.1 MAG: hypothetical protein DWQ47_05975 [Acidobacteriota bacterium]
MPVGVPPAILQASLLTSVVNLIAASTPVTLPISISSPVRPTLSFSALIRPSAKLFLPSLLP